MQTNCFLLLFRHLVFTENKPTDESNITTKTTRVDNHICTTKLNAISMVMWLHVLAC